ncbi:MAG: LuxR C-terminal-related transcriptional regulator [Verrucomicrobiota bacterium]
MKPAKQPATAKVWLICHGADPDSEPARSLRKIIRNTSLTTFDSIESIRRAATTEICPEVILACGVLSPPAIQQLQELYPVAQILIITSARDVIATAEAANTFSRPMAPNRPLPQFDYALTKREKSILRLMVEGWLKKEIAEHLSLSFHTVNNHERHIYEKLHVHTRSAAVAKALMEDLLS